MHAGARLRLIATIEEPAVVDRIVRHLGLPTDLALSSPRVRRRLGMAR